MADDMSVSGAPLLRLNLPQVSTLVVKESQESQLFMIPSDIDLEDQTTTTTLDVVGSQLTITSLADRETAPGEPTFDPRSDLPHNIHQAREVLERITSGRSGGKKNIFNINELRIIARRLNLTTTGNKETLVNRIREHIIGFAVPKK